VTTTPQGAWRALIVDDEPPARRTLRLLLDAEPGVEVVGECDHGGAAVDAVRSLRPHVLFLDVQMPGLTGLDVLEDVGLDAVPVLVFVTAYDQYALRAFEAQALDYLLKPFSDERFGAVMRRVRRTLAERARGFENRRLIVRDGARTLVLPWDDIDWIEAEDYCIRIHAGAAHPLVRQSLRATLARLDASRFVRIHRSAVVNLDRVRRVHALPSGDAEVVLADGRILRASRSYRAALDTRLAG
jgi:two-component system, LytTR family, response regulator